MRGNIIFFFNVSAFVEESANREGPIEGMLRYAGFELNLNCYDDRRYIANSRKDLPSLPLFLCSWSFY